MLLPAWGPVRAWTLTEVGRPAQWLEEVALGCQESDIRKPVHVAGCWLAVNLLSFGSVNTIAHARSQSKSIQR